MDDRLTDSLAQKLYETHMAWRAELSEYDTMWVRWFALDKDLKKPYWDAARDLDEATEARQNKAAA